MAKYFSHIFCSLSLVLLLGSCAGYHLGGTKPTHLGHVKSVHIPLFHNNTLITRVESHATNSAVDAVTRDGTYAIDTSSHADAVLRGTVSSVRYSPVSTSRDDSETTEELSMTITLAWSLHDLNDSLRILEQGKSTGRTRFFAGSNLNVARTNALPDALRRASESMTSQLADGF